MSGPVTSGTASTRIGSRFWRLFYAYSVNTAGDEFYVIALPLVLLSLGYPAFTVTLLFGVLTATTVVAGFVVGAVVDRSTTQHLLLVSYLVSAAALLSGAAVAFWRPDDGFVVATAIAMVLGVFAAISAAAVDAGVPRLLTDTRMITRGYSLIESSRSVASILGPALAGFAAALHSLVTVLVLNGASFLVAAGIAGRGRPRPAARPPGSATIGRTPSAWIQVVGAGLKDIVHNSRLRIGIALSVTVNIALGAEQPLFLGRLVQEIGVSTVAASVVVVLAGVTSIGATLLLAYRARPTTPRFGMLAASAVTALAAVGVGLTTNIYAATFLYCILSAATVYYNVCWRTYRQSVVAADLLGRVSASCRSLAYLGVVVGVAAVGTLQGLGASTSTLFIAGGVLALTATAVVTAASRRDAAGRTGGAERVEGTT